MDYRRREGGQHCNVGPSVRRDTNQMIKSEKTKRSMINVRNHDEIGIG